jgi:endonuclease YncB( thermonuclease family)
MDPIETKPWYASKGVWGGVVAVIAGALGLLGYTFGIEEQERLVEGILQLIAVVGGALGLYGRVVATKPISLGADPRKANLLIWALALPLCLMVCASAAQAAPKGVQWQGPFKVQVLSVTDGDSVEVLFKEGPCAEGGRGAPCPGSILSLRIRGIDTPEKKLCQARKSQSCAACKEEENLGKAATKFANDLLVGKLVTVAKDLGKDPYFGRIVGSLDILHEGRMQSYAALIMEAGLATRYEPLEDGSYAKPKGWCPKVSNARPTSQR